jgi:hypothetical protein
MRQRSNPRKTWLSFPFVMAGLVPAIHVDHGITSLSAGHCRA